MRSAIDLAYRLRRRVLALLRWRTRGVKVMAFDPAGRLLLVRHRYGRSDLWMLPGGGIKRGETPGSAAARELVEETACRVSDITLVGRFVAGAEGRRDTVHLFRGVTVDSPVVDGVELAEAAFFALASLPNNVSPATLRRIGEHRREHVANGRW